MKTVMKLFRVVCLFVTLMVIGGFIFCSQDIVNIYENFYGTFSWKSVTCLLISAFVAGLSFRVNIPKSPKKENHNA